MPSVGKAGPTFAFAALACTIGLATGFARADPATDATYGRVQGDLTFVGALGATVGEGGARPEAELRLRYLASVGLFGTYEDGPLVAAASVPARVVAAGLELRPLFLFRWLTGTESGRPWLDLTIDSIGLELAATSVQPSGQGFASLGGLQAALAIEVPLLAEASGPWVGVRGGLRWSDATSSTGGVRDDSDRSAFLTFSLAWHQVVVGHVVDVGDEAPR